MRLVEAGVRLEVGEVEGAAEVADAAFEDIDRPPLLDLGPDPVEELPAGPGPALLLEFLPFLCLGGVDETAEIIRDEAEAAVVVGAGAEAVVEVGVDEGVLFVEGRREFAGEGLYDRLFKVRFGYCRDNLPDCLLSDLLGVREAAVWLVMVTGR